MHYKEFNLSNVWRTCNKIRAAIFRVGISLWEHYLPLDPEKNCLISESQFVSVLAGPLKEAIGLSEEEINELTDYFRVQDGRILYTQMCEVIHGSVPDFSKNANLVSGLEWEDPMHVNRLGISEERRLNLLITKIAAIVNLRRLILRPYFQDYELIAKNVGTVTIAHFARVLAYLGIIVSADDFHLLVKRFVKDSYTVNYVAFLAAVDLAVGYMDRHGLTDLGGDVVNQFPGRVVSAELPKLPRPEIGKVLLSAVIGKQDNFHPSIALPTPDDDLAVVIKRVQRHVLGNGVRVNEFFRDFDPFRCGKITVSQFHRGLETMGIGRIHRLFLSEPEVRMLTARYADPLDPDRVCWQTFENDVDRVFAVKCLEKVPSLRVQAPPADVLELPRKGTKCWQTVNTERRDLCEDTMRKIKTKLAQRRILLKPAFGDYDRGNNGHVSRNQMRQCFTNYSILLSDEELYALEERFNDDLGFNYFWLLKEIESRPPESPLYESFLEDKKRLNAPRPAPAAARAEHDIVAVLAKIKGRVVAERIRVSEFLTDYDRHNERVVSQEDFRRGLAQCRLGLTAAELDTLLRVFASPLRPRFVDYRRFCDTVEEAFTQPGLERAPLLVPLQHVPSRDCERHFLNFDERRTVSRAMQKLSKVPELEMNLTDLFRDYDKTNCGTVSSHQLLKVLAVRGLLNALSTNEFEAVCKCFGRERGLREEVDYRALCKALNVLAINEKYKPF